MVFDTSRMQNQQMHGTSWVQRPVWLVQSPEAALALAEEELAKAKQATMDGLNGDMSEPQTA